MPMDFPAAPVAGDIYTFGGVSFQFDGVDGVWRAMAAPSGPATIGDFKHGFQTGDHGGWIKLNGRAVTTLLPGQQVEAAAFGWTANLPDATSCFLVQSGSTAPGAISGNSAKTIALANLPVHNLSLTALDIAPYDFASATTSGWDPGAIGTSSNGAHGHESEAHTGGATAGFEHPDMAWNKWHTGAQIMNEGAAYTANRKLVKDVGDHSHTVDLPNHTHTLDLGSHDHTIGGTLPLGGSGTAIDITPKHLSANAFCYLGMV